MGHLGKWYRTVTDGDRRPRCLCSRRKCRDLHAENLVVLTLCSVVPFTLSSNQSVHIHLRFNRKFTVNVILTDQLPQNSTEALSGALAVSGK